MSKKVIIFGSTGTVGTALAEILSRDHGDWKILAATRNANLSTRLSEMRLPNVEIIQADAGERESTILASKDCDIIFSCIGFPQYERKYWAKHWPIVLENLLAATGPSKKLIFCDNLYMYGPGTDISPTKTEIVEASTRSKPAIRAGLRQRMKEHMKKNPGTLAVVGASDFFGPYVIDKSVLGSMIADKIVNGGTPMILGSRTALHDFCYVPDFAKALAVVAVDERAYDHFWIAPHSIHNKPVQDVANDIAEKAGRSSPVSITVLGKCMCYTLSPFMPIMGEMIEMMPFWTNDYTVDDSDFVREFGVSATSYDEALQETVTSLAAQKK